METVADGFREADDSGGFDRLLKCLDVINGLADFRAYKEASWRRLHPERGGAFCDVACGPGFDVVEMAARWPGARFVGVDASQWFLDVARARSVRVANAEFDYGEATGLPYPDAAFDGARIDRSLQHMPDPQAAIAEIVRIVRPGGRVVLSEPDWGTFVLANGDASSETIASRFAAMLRNPHIGRELAGRLAECGLNVLGAEVSAVRLDCFQDADIVYDLKATVALCETDGLLSAEEGRRWLERSRAASKTRTFLALICIVTAAAERRA